MTRKNKKIEKIKEASKKETEIFEIEKDGKTKIVEVDAEVNEIGEKEGQVNEEKGMLKNILIILGVMIFFLALFLTYYFLRNHSASFIYEKVKFDIINDPGFGLLYHTKIPKTINGQDYEYNFYLRKDPRYLVKNIPFNGNLTLYKNNFINLTNEFYCNGDAIIAGQNLINQYNFIGMNLSRNENISCDSLGRYAQIQIVKSNKTYIEENSENCYTIYVKDCHILDALERFMVEVFVVYKNMPETLEIRPRIIIENKSRK